MRAFARIGAWVLCAFMGGTALAEKPFTTINGTNYATGYLPWPKGVERPHELAPLFNAGELPESYDSREHGFITAVKNQGNCGSCWAFARTGAFEAALIVAGKATALQLDLAEQDTVSGDRNSSGCGGGYMDGDYEKNYGVTTEALCPYTARNSPNCSGKPKFGKADRWALLPGSPTDDQLRAAIYQYKSLFVTVAAGGDFEPNGDGRITSCGSRSINHMVQIVAYRPAPSGGYEYLIKNSWGTSWGDDGFAWSKKGCNKLANESGDAAGYFFVEGAPPPPPPPPPPPTDRVLGLPVEYRITKGHDVALQVRAEPAGRKCVWSTGEKGCRIWVRPTAATEYSLTVKDVGKDAVTEKTKVSPQ